MENTRITTIIFSPNTMDNPHRTLKNKGIIVVDAFQAMTGNKAYLADFQDFNGGPVAFGGSKGYITGKGKIKTGKLDFEDVSFVKELQPFNLFSVSQMCDKKNKVLFTDSECLVLSPDFKLPDENQILLKVPRQNNMYSFNLENIVPLGGLACLIAKATTDESNLWHRRLGHVNFKNLNRLVKGNLVRGLPTKLFQNDHTCVACQKGKQHKASCKAKVVSSISHTLQLLHMDLFGPTSVRSINHKTYCLVITDDFSRFSWTFFLRTKDETSAILKDFIRQIENQLNQKGSKGNTAMPELHNKMELLRERTGPLLRQQGPCLQIYFYLTLFGLVEAVSTACYERSKGPERITDRCRRGKCGRVALREKDVNGDERGLEVVRQAKEAHEEVKLLTKNLEQETENLEVSIVVKALYWVTSSSLSLVCYFIHFLVEEWIRRGTIDKTLFLKKDKHDIILVQVYVDDIIFGSTKKSWCDEFEALMKSRFQMSSMGELTFFLGLQVKQKPDGIFISQDKYVAEILKKFDFASVKTASTPIETQKPLVKDEEARFQVTPKTSHLSAVKRKLGTPQQGGCQILVGGLITWQCKKQTIVATSTTEAEYVAAASCCGQVLWIQNQIKSWPLFKSKKIAQVVHAWIKSKNSLVKHFEDMRLNRPSKEYLQVWFNPPRDLSMSCLTTKGMRNNGTMHITAKVAGKVVSISEASIRTDLIFDDADGIDSLPNQAIFDAIQLMGYEAKGFNWQSYTLVWILCWSNQLGEGASQETILTVPFKPNNLTNHHPDPSPISIVPDLIPEPTGENLGDHSSNDASLSGFQFQAKEIKLLKAKIKKLKKQAKPVIKHHKEYLKIISLQQRFPKKSFSKVHKKNVSKQGRKKAKGESEVHRDPLFDVMPEDKIDQMETEDAQSEGRTRDMVNEEKDFDEERLSTEDEVSTVKEGVSTDFEKVSTDRPKVSTDESKVSTDEQVEGTEETNEGSEEIFESTEEQREGTEDKVSTDEQMEGTEDQTKEEIASKASQTSTQTPTSMTFGDDETIATLLINMSKAKAASKEKEKGVELKDVEDIDRPRPTSTRSLLTLKPLPKIDPKDKGKKKIEEEEESESEDDDIPQAVKKFKQLETFIKKFDDIKARIKADRILAEKLQEQEREQFTIEERAKFLHDTIAAQRKFLARQRSEVIRNRPPTKNQLRNQMMTFLKHVGNFKHSELKSKKFEDIQAMYEKIKRSDEDFIAIGSVEDDRLITKMNKKDSSKEEEINQESKVEVKEEDKGEENTRKRKHSTRKKMKSRKRRFKQDTSQDDPSDTKKENEELRLCLTIAPDEDKGVEYEILDKKYPIIDWKTENLGTKPQFDESKRSEEINMNVVTRSNGQKRSFSTLIGVLSVFDREDLNAIYKLVMDIYQDRIPEGFDKVLWGDLIVMFNPDEQDEFWNSQHEWKVISWKLHSSSGVHTLMTDEGLVIHMLIEKKYPLKKEIVVQMLKLKLESEEESTMALELIRFIKKGTQLTLLLCLANEAICKSSCPQLDHEDLDQVDEYDLEEMDLKWQVAMISMRIKKFYKKTGRKLQFDAKEPGSRTGKKEESKALVTVDGESVDWTTHSEDDENYAFMASNSSGSDTQVPSCSNECKESYANLKRLYDAQREQLSDASVEIKAYTQGLKKGDATVVALTGRTLYRTELVSEPVVNESNVEVQPKVWSDAPIIEEYESDSDDEYVSVQTKGLDTPSFANKQVNTPKENVKHQSTHSQKPKVNNKELGHGFTERACFVCGRGNNMNNVQRVNKQNQFVPLAVQTRTGNNPVNTAKASSTNNFSTARQKVNRQTVLTSTALKVNTVKPIVNGVDQQYHLGKFVGKSDEGFLVGYSIQSKAFRVYNLETKRVEENLHINFLENKPNVAGKGPTWLFDLDYLTDSMNYHSVRSENQANLHAGQQESNQNTCTKDKIDAGDFEKEDESDQDCFDCQYGIPILPQTHLLQNQIIRKEVHERKNKSSG
ncbi:putative ribonuclease H-like domain-containing protein [Tanacetum coccineum]|uniref:Ribonuclease H-like domain-containing protein n=1 Tax=Tanacetum coccineum TaxID=301880 RepID=A0ABQ5AX64_9ASTR